ncbi:MAG TPA: DNA repair protein RadC [Pseudomonadales bacterium]|nr:DNA repair protein RadC [Pseudomonadales bacterium]
MKINDWPPDERPRERLLAQGSAGLSDAELVAVLLRTGGGGSDAVELARALLREYGSLRALLDTPVADLVRRPGLGPAKAAVLAAALALSERYLACAIVREEVFGASADVRRYLRARLGGRLREVFCAMFLDAQHRLIAFRELFLGTIDSAAVHPREVLREALSFNAAAVIFVHNHPSGVAEPSTSDMRITDRLRHALQLIDVRVLDHIVVSADATVSMAERGLL